MKNILSLILFVLLATPVFATHFYGAEINYVYHGNDSVTAYIYTYTTDISGPPDSDTVTINWGDNTSSALWRNGSGTVFNFNVKTNIYVGGHKYAAGTNHALLSLSEPNRIAGISNINGGNSVNVAMYVEALVIFAECEVYSALDEGGGPLYRVLKGNPFSYHFSLQDSTGDSLSYELITPMQSRTDPVPNYEYPDSIAAGSFTVNSTTGTVSWDTTTSAGVFTYAVKVTRYRNGQLLGYTVRDFILFVANSILTYPEFLGIDTMPTDSEGNIHYYLSVGDTLEIIVPFQNINPLIEDTRLELTGEANLPQFDGHILFATSFPSVMQATSLIRIDAHTDLAREQPYIVNLRGSSRVYDTGSNFVGRDYLDLPILVTIAGTQSHDACVIPAYDTTLNIGSITKDLHRTLAADVFPNPSTGLVTIDFGVIRNSCTIKLVSLTGALLLEKHSTSEISVQIDVTKFESGIYLLQIIDENYNQLVKKLVINR